MKVGKSVVQFKRYNSMRNHKLNTNPQYYALYTRKGDFFKDNVGKKYDYCNYTKEEIIKLLKRCTVRHVFDAYPRAHQYAHNHKIYSYSYNMFVEWFNVEYNGLSVCDFNKDGKLVYVKDEFKTKVPYFKRQFFTRNKDTHAYKLTAFAQHLILKEKDTYPSCDR